MGPAGTVIRGILLRAEEADDVQDFKAVEKRAWELGLFCVAPRSLGCLPNLGDGQTIVIIGSLASEASYSNNFGVYQIGNLGGIALLDSRTGDVKNPRGIEFRLDDIQIGVALMKLASHFEGLKRIEYPSSLRLRTFIVLSDM